MLSNLFGSTKTVVCPYCLAEIHYRNIEEVLHCPKSKGGCGAELEKKYILKYDHMMPCFTQLIGWSRVGKTVYLGALTATLMKLGAIWKNNYAPAALTEATLKYTRSQRTFMSTGQMPAGTQLEIQDAYIMQLENMERWNSRTLVLRDVAGEHFNDLNFPIEQTPYLLHVPTTLMMVSVQDLRKQNFSMDELMSGYIHTLMKHDKKYGKTRRKVVMVLSKADMLMDELPEKVRRYVQEDPIRPIWSSPDSVAPMDAQAMNQYMKNMENISQDIQDWVSHLEGGDILNSLAKNENIELHFSLVTSTGAAVDGNTLNVSVNPARVLDPFFWSLELQSKPG
jgi:hypothetical protein